MPSTSQKTRIAIAFACVYFFWGSTYSAIYIAGLHIAPPLVGAARSLLSTVIICGICVARGVSLRVPGATAWRLALVGILVLDGQFRLATLILLGGLAVKTLIARGAGW